MKIKMTVAFSGEWTCNAGDVVERPEDEAARLIEAGFAVPVRDAAPVETATRKVQAEKAAK
jgi:hypothetical protein